VDHRDTIAPAYTHLQQSQPVSFAHHLLAHAWPLVRDGERFTGLQRRLDESPLGAGASGGTTLALDPEATAAELGFTRTFANSLDAIASRDVATEFVFVAAQALASLSRLAADITLWCTAEFGWMTLSDSFATGSSALPHKKNPDVAELVRGGAAAVTGDLVAMLALQHGLPSSYNRDLQNDKRAVFHADDTLGLGVAALRGLVDTADFHPASPDPNTVAVDVAERLVARGMPFRQAHRTVGELVARLERAGRDLSGVTEEDVAGSEIKLGDVPTPAESAARRALPGTGNPGLVTSQVEKLRLRLRDLG
jgi:argininosuccinate lyase